MKKVLIGYVCKEQDISKTNYVEFGYFGRRNEMAEFVELRKEKFLDSKRIRIAIEEI